ncbi:MAG TPA: hypothetical protein VH142_00830 [Polyangiaceae bacterium]|nr:hypothetical protein [Polyangiaceae bacterium]
MRPALALAVLLAPTSLYAQERSDPNDLPPIEQKQAQPTGLVVPVSIMGGLRAAGAYNLGKNAPDSGSNPNGAVAGIDLGLEVGALVWDHIYAGIMGGGTLFVSPPSTTSSVSSFVFATEFGWLTNAHGFGGYFGLGVGYRAIFVSDALGNANKYDGAEGLATVALHFKIGELVRVLPRIDFSVGPSGDSQAHAILSLGFSIWLNDDVHPKKRKRAQP